MNALAQTFVTAFGSVAAAAAIGIGLADHAAEPSSQVAQLERVAVTAPAAGNQVVAKLPRVVVEHRRTMHTLALAQAESARPL